MKLRHRLIRLLSCGDMVMINFERRSHGITVPKNLGTVLIDNVTFEMWSLDVGIVVGPWSPRTPTAGLHLSFVPAGASLNNLQFEGLR